MLLYTAPNDEAFSRLPAETVQSLFLPENKDQLANILLYHVAPDEYPSSSLSNGQEITMANEDSIHVSVSRAIMKQRKRMKRGVVPYISDTTGIKINNANVIKADIRALNGIVHVIDEVLLPGEAGSKQGGSMHGGYSKSSKRGKTSKSAKRSKTSKSAKVSKSTKAVIIYAKSSKKGKSKGKK